MKKMKCPVCGGEFKSGYKLVSKQHSHAHVLQSLDSNWWGKLYALRCRICVECGHVDFYIPKSELEKIDT